MSVSIVVCTYNRYEFLNKCLESLLNQTYKDIEIIVVVKDIGPNIQTQINDFKHINLIIQPTNSMGLSAARNLGIQNANGEIIAFIDDDAVADIFWIQNLSTKYENPLVGGVGGLIVDHSSNEPWLFDWYINMFGITRPSNKIGNNEKWFRSFVGCNMSFRKELLDKMGGFDETYIFSHEESDLCVRILKEGYLLEVEPTAMVTHYLGDGPTRSIGLYFKCRSRLYFALKNFGNEIPKWRIILEDLKLLPSEILYVFRSLSLRNLKAIILARFHEYKRWNII